jgi:3-hydroxyisobutyrate dehydrogenase-like beta-hydroxyacid dehydrogenase
MGSRLTQRLHSSGWNVRAWNRSPEPARELRQSGVPIVPSIVDLVSNSDVILSCLANDAAVHSVYCDSAGVFSAAKPGTIVLEMSTISPQLSHLLHREASSLGVSLLDVAISGSRQQSRLERSPCSPVGIEMLSSNACLYTRPLPSGGS